jgi:hypothetical protein
MKYLILALTTITIWSCNPSKKLDKLNKKHPEIVAKFCFDKFPCVTSKIDTIKEIEYEFVSVECPEYKAKDTVVITRNTIVKGSAVLKYVKQNNTIIKTVRDSAQIVFCELELIALNKKCNQLTEDNISLKNKVSAKNRYISWLIIAILCAIIGNILQLKK